MERGSYIEKQLGLLMEAFGLRRRLTVEEYLELETCFHSGDFLACVNLVKARFDLQDFNIKIIHEKSKKFKDRFRLTWLDWIYNFFWQMNEKPKTQDFPNPICLISHHRDKEDPPDFVPYGTLKIRPWGKRLPLKTFIFLVAVGLAWTWIYECEQVRLFKQDHANAELLALIAGFGYAAEEGRSIGRYDFSLLDDHDFNRVTRILYKERERQGLIPDYLK